MRILATFLVGLAVGAASMWFAVPYLKYGDATSPNALATVRETGPSEKFVCSGAEICEFRPNGTFYLTVPAGITMAGTCAIEGDRVNVIVNGRSIVFTYRNGTLSWGYGNCAKA